MEMDPSRLTADEVRDLTQLHAELERDGDFEPLLATLVAEPVFERADYLEEVAKIFRAIERPYFQRIDASRSQQEVHAELWEQLAVLRAAVT